MGDATRGRGRITWSGRSLLAAPRRLGVVVVTVLCLAAASLTNVPVASAGLLGSLSTVQVIITASSAGSAQALVLGLLGRVLTALPIVNGVVADVSSALIPVLKALPGVTVTPDVGVVVGTSPPPVAPASPVNVFPQVTGASSLVAAGVNGGGVNVAVIDTGIDNLPDFAGRLVGGVDLSGGNSPFVDSYGHGTFVAGLIAGDGASSAGRYVGEAPDAGLVSVKVAGASGTTDMGTVIAGLQWVVANRARLAIRVVNLSLGVPPTSSTALNPLDQAAEAAWNAGIVVVASAGNAGPFNGTVLSPGDDPLVITAGALDDNATVATGDDTVPTFSSVGPTSPDGWFKPDLVASGRSVISVRAPGSTIDTQNPTARIGAANFVGSGTSFSAAITSGAAALVIEANPTATPDQVKGRLLATATPGPTGNPFVDGHGALDAYAAATATGIQLTQSRVPAVATAVGATVSLATTWAASTWNGSAWNGSAWNGSAWNGSEWNGSAWNGSAWNGSAWNGSAWNEAAWNGSAWNGSTWNGSAWNGSAWNGSAWNGSAWNSSAWG